MNETERRRRLRRVYELLASLAKDSEATGRGSLGSDIRSASSISASRPTAQRRRRLTASKTQAEKSVV
jgi:hypothetical protein